MASVSITSAWLHSVDAVYHLFEDENLRKQYPGLAAKVEQSVRLAEEVFTDTGLERCALSFNGGKDCTVIVHILAAVLRRMQNLSSPPASSSSSNSKPSSAQQLVSLPSVYITCPSPFPVLESFIRASQVRYNLDLYTVDGGMKDGLVEYFDGGGEVGVPSFGEREKRATPTSRIDASRKNRDVKAVFIGTRRTDPTGETLEPRKWTDPSWPSVERIHLILDWDYSDVWAFLRCPALATPNSAASDGDIDGDQERCLLPGDAEARFGSAAGGSEGVPYCILYDQGYTSLGSTFNTFPNPLLELEGGKGQFRPAWQLADGSTERAGRGDKKQSDESKSGQ